MEAISRALTQTSGNRSEAARLLGVSPRTFFYKLRRIKTLEGDRWHDKQISRL